MIRLAVTLALLATTAHAQTAAPVLGPGQEEAVLEMLRVDACELLAARIERDHIQARYRCTEEHEVVLRHPSSSESALQTQRFALEGDAPSALTDALLQSIRTHEHGVQWSVPIVAAPSESSSSSLPWPTWGLMLLLLLVVSAELSGARPQRAHAILLVVALAIVVVPEWGPLHEHLTFTARSDCARIGCDRERPGWLAPTYHAYRGLLALVPYTSKGLSFLSALLTLVALGAQLAWLRRVAPRAAVLAVVACGLHPIVLHAAVAHSFWPFALATFFIGAWLAEREGLRAKLGAAAAFALAATSSIAMLGPVAIFTARMAWRDRKHAWTTLLPLAFVAIYAAPFVAGLGGDLGARFAPRHFVDHALFDPRVSPFGFGLLVVAGAWLGRRTGWALASALAVLSALPALGEPLEVGFPVALLHGFPLVVLAAPLVAFAWVSVPTKLRALPVALLVLSAPTAIEAWSLELPAVTREQRAIELALPSLPPHRRLVIAPEILEPMRQRWDGDPIEVRFPVGFYRAHGFDAEIVHLDDFLEEAPPDAEDTLIYIGTSLVSFHPSEIDDEVRSDPRRPILRRLDASLEPISTFQLSTRSHRWMLMRVAADTSATIELGFHRVHR